MVEATALLDREAGVEHALLVERLAHALPADKMRQHIRKPLILRRLTQAGGITLIGMGALTATLRRATP